MSIEVKCPGCQSLLRIADENVGRKARCPSCSQMFIAETPVEVEPQAVSPSPDNAPLPDLSQSEPPLQGVVTPSNPYAPTYSEPVPQAAPGSIKPTRISHDEVMSKSWRIFKMHWVMVCVVVLIVGGINIACNMLQNLAVSGVEMAVGEPAISLGVQALLAVIFWVLKIWLQLGQIMVMLDVARGRPIIINKLFAGGPYLVNGVFAMIVVTAVIGSIALVLVGIPIGLGAAVTQTPEGAIIGGFVGLLISVVPIVIISLAVSQIQTLIVDQKVGPIESLRISYDITNGNRLTIFVIFSFLALIWFGAAIVGLLMLCVGIIPAMIAAGGFSALVLAVAYLSMTGQAIVVPGDGNDPSGTQFSSVIP